MCGPSLFAEHAAVVCAAHDLEHVLHRYYGVRLEKASGVGTERGFVRVVGRLAARLRARASPVESAAVRAAMGELSVSWREIAVSDAAISRAARAARKAFANLPAALAGTLAQTAEKVVGDARADLRRRRGLAIGVDLNALDMRVVDHVAGSHTNFVRDELGRRADAMSSKAREVVSNALEAGLREDAIARELEATVGVILRGRSPAYWDVVANAFVGTARSFGQISSYAEAGIERYRVSAVLDQHTTRTCRYLHGRVFSVRTAVSRFEQLEATEDPESVKALLPWVREARDSKTSLVVLYVGRGDRRVALAAEERTGMGRRDDRGEFRALVSEAQLADTIGFPPYHGACRSVTVPE